MTLTSSAASTLPIRYQWQYKGKSISGATNANYTIALSSVANSGEYRVVATTTSGSATSATAVATILIPPSIARAPKSVLVGNTLKASFSIKAAGSAALGYQWQFNNANIPGADGPTHSIENAQPSQIGSYRCIVTNQVGMTMSAEAELSGVAVKKQPRSLTLQSGKRATFSAKGAGPSPLRYQWWKNGGIISGATNANYTIPAVSFGDEGTYYVQIISPLAAALSTNVQLTVMPQMLAVTSPKTLGSSAAVKLSIESPRDGFVTIIVRGAPLVQVSVERTTDLSDWQLVKDVVLDASGLATFRDAASHGQQFYRAVQK